MGLHYSAGLGGFLDPAIHGDLPADAVAVAPARHAELLAAQATGRTIVAGDDGRPRLKPLVGTPRSRALSAALDAIRREAERRILTVASPVRQSNDLAAVSLYALSLAMGGDAPTPADEASVLAATRRRAAIDAIRTASNTLEARITGWALAALTRFDAGADIHWPEIRS